MAFLSVPQNYLPILISILAYLILWIVKNVVISRLKKFSQDTETYLDDVVLISLEKTKFFFILGASLYIGFQTSVFDNKKYGPVADKLFLILFSVQVLFWGVEGISNWFDFAAKKRNGDPSLKTSFGFLSLIVKVSFVITVVMFTLNNLGVNVSTFVTGLGVGGVAIALATQNILGDLFSSLSIVLDKPFVVGDTINLGEWQGEVEHIGLKTTRIRSLSGEQIIISNSDLLSSKIRNFKRMQRRRVVFRLGVTYQAKRENLRLIPNLMSEIISKYQNAELDRAHFVAYGGSSLDFEIVYWVTTPEYKDYADIHQEILFDIHESFEKHDLQFAYPTQTLYIEKT